MKRQHRKGRTALYLQSASDYSITDHAGATLTIEQARERWTAGVDDWNIAFARLVDSNFDLGAVKAYYRAAAERCRR
jgi:hypothetical protein